MEIYGDTTKGLIRKKNEDSFLIKKNVTKKFKNLFIVADGMGGHLGGEIASCDLVVEFEKFLKLEDSNDKKIDIMIKVLAKVNKIIYDKSEREEKLKGMGTTSSILTIDKNKGHIVHVGDSRIYTFADNTIKLVTEDHTYVSELVKKGEISEENAKIHPNKNVITRAIGIDKFVKIDKIEIDLKKTKYILMCTDGLTNTVSDNVIEQLLKGKGAVGDIVNQLISKANENGGIDNSTVILIKL